MFNINCSKCKELSGVSHQMYRFLMDFKKIEPFSKVCTDVTVRAIDLEMEGIIKTEILLCFILIYYHFCVKKINPIVSVVFI